MTEGRWAGNWYEWACPGCGCMRTSLNAPPPDQASCLRCKANNAAKSIQEMVNALQDERDNWMGRARAAERIQQAQCDEIYELQQQLKKLQGEAA